VTCPVVLPRSLGFFSGTGEDLSSYLLLCFSEIHPPFFPPRSSQHIVAGTSPARGLSVARSAVITSWFLMFSQNFPWLLEFKLSAA